MANYHYSYSGNQGGSSQRMRRKNNWIVYFILALIIVSTPVAYFIISNDSQQEERTKTPKANDVPPPTSTKTQQNQPKSQPIPSDIATLIQQGNEALSNNDYGQAKSIALKIIHNPTVKKYSKAWEDAVEILNAANTKIIMTGYFLEGKKLLYTVKRGDALARIAKKFKTTVAIIQRNNGMKPTDYNIRIGQTLSIYAGDWHITISKKHYRLFLYDGKDLFKVYRVGLGKQNRTPLGTFVITAKTKEPDWYSPTQGKIPYGDKRNVLGTRWMKLKPTGTTNPGLHGYGIHGTAYPDSIGKNESNGCIRMKNEDVEELFSIVPSGVNVTIEK